LKEWLKELKSNERVEEARYAVSRDMDNESWPMWRSKLED
jgi:hypothetical protein